MEFNQLISNYSTAVDMISFVTCITLLFVIHWVLYFSKDKKFIFLKRALYFILAGTLLNISFSMQCKYNIEIPFCAFLTRDLYHLCFMCCLYLFLLYLKKMLAMEGRLVSVMTVTTRVLFISCAITDSLSPFTHFGFHKDGNLWKDPIINPYNIFYVYAVFMMIMILLFFGERMIQSVRYCLLATAGIVAVIMTRSAYDNTNTFTSYTYVLPIIVMMILLHSKPFDEKTGALGEDSFDKYIAEALHRGVNLDFMILKLNMKVVTKLPDELGRELNTFWHTSFKNAKLFAMHNDLFVLVVPRLAKNGDTEEKVTHLIRDVFKSSYAKYQIPYKVIGLFDLDFIQNESEVKTIIDYMLYTMKDNTMIISDDKLKEQLRILRDIKDNLMDIEVKNDLMDERVTVFCQPIKNMQTGEYDTAEALMRLSLPEKGLVMPYLFIPLAEYYGYIHSLTKIMLNKVCAGIKELETEGYKFERISINFAASEIRAENFCEEILEIIKKNGIAPSKIGIEITESQTENDLMIVKDKMSVLREKGMIFYLDDVGTGYSNLDRIVRYDVDVVKFDRFFVLEAEKNPKVANMMKHLSEAFKDLNYTLLYEGVETEENEQLCLGCGAEYIQGFKYSKPVPMNELREFFAK